MRSYINKGLIILVLIFANILLPMKKELPKYENTKIKEKFNFAGGKDEEKLKKAKKISIAKADINGEERNKNEIINNILINNIDIANLDNTQGNMYDFINNNEEINNEYFEDEEADLDAIVLDNDDNSLLDTWQINDASVFHESKDSLVLYKKSGDITLRAKNYISVCKNIININFEGCTNANLVIKTQGIEKRIALSRISNLKYFYLGDDYKYSKVVAIEFINDNENDFYLSIGEIRYE